MSTVVLGPSDSPARTALPISVTSDVGVFLRKGVPALACVGCGYLGIGRVTAQNVLSLRHCLKMVRVDAATIVAKMIQHKALRNRSLSLLPVVAVSCPSSTIDAQLPVSGGSPRSHPVPTTRNRINRIGLGVGPSLVAPDIANGVACDIATLTLVIPGYLGLSATATQTKAGRIRRHFGIFGLCHLGLLSRLGCHHSRGRVRAARPFAVSILPSLALADLVPERDVA